MTQTRSKFPIIILLLPLLFLLFGLINIGLPKIPNMAPEPSLALDTVYQAPYNLSVSASGEVEVPLPTDSRNMPNCEDFEMTGCGWESKLRRKVTGEDTVIETKLVKDGKTIGRAEVMEIETLEYEELKILHEMGHEKAWISYIRVARAYRGNGLGRAMWQASDAMIKTLVGSGNAVHIFVDQAGWGNAIMRDIPGADILVQSGDYWAYVVR